MIYWLRNLAAYAVAAVSAAAVVAWIGSPIVLVLVPNLATVVLALLAINVQTTAVIAVKLRELIDRSSSSAPLSVREFRLALLEQAFLALLAVAIHAAQGATAIQVSPHVIAVATFFVLFASVHIFLDTSIGLLVSLFPD